MREDVYGSIKFGNSIDITDPSYDEDVWCRINNFPIPAGEYECYAVIADDTETDGWGNRVARIGIRRDKSIYEERKGMIGVDSGMAGFFNCDNRIIFEDILREYPTAADVFIYNNAFVSSSGYGDGGYDVWVGYSHGEIVEVYIEFIKDEN